MGSLCSVFASKEKDDLLTTFWQSMNIRKDPASNIVISLNAIKLDSGVIKKEDWDKIANQYLVSSKYGAEAEKLRLYLYDKYHKQSILLLLSLFFLCEENQNIEAEMKKFLVTFKVCSKDKNAEFTKNTLQQLLLIYFNTISKISLDYMKDVINEEEYYKTMTEAYDEKIQEEYINSILEKEPESGIEVSRFLATQYNLLIKDDKIRKNLKDFWKSKSK